MDIIKNRVKFFTVSLVIILAGIFAMVYHQMRGEGIFNFDIEFTGGTSMEFNIGKEFDVNEVEEIVKDITGQPSPQVQEVYDLGEADTNRVSIKVQSIDSEMRTSLIQAIEEKYGLDESALLNVTDVSGTISGEMQRSAIIAVVAACIAMLIYISIRFKDVRAGGSSILALLHDVMVMIACYAILRIPVNNSFIAALLTILGYSINSTIVIFDRIRENRSKFRKKDTAEMINKSVNQTLARSINTSLTTLFTIGMMYVLGVSSIKEFSLPLIIGIISGAYSSVFLSGAIWYMLLPKNQKS
ncbi:MAG: protein translocase subunit SecF [Clostridiales bacterium]|nr:protein translocase subunit SecF [Clostridiales bacterium]